MHDETFGMIKKLCYFNKFSFHFGSSQILINFPTVSSPSRPHDDDDKPDIVYTILTVLIYHSRFNFNVNAVLHATSDLAQDGRAYEGI